MRWSLLTKGRFALTARWRSAAQWRATAASSVRFSVISPGSPPKIHKDRWMDKGDDTIPHTQTHSISQQPGTDGRLSLRPSLLSSVPPHHLAGVGRCKWFKAQQCAFTSKHTHTHIDFTGNNSVRFRHRGYFVRLRKRCICISDPTLAMASKRTQELLFVSVIPDYKVPARRLWQGCDEIIANCNEVCRTH